MDASIARNGLTGKQVVTTNYRLWWETRRLVEKFAAAGIPSVVLKGAATAYYYPTPELRQAGDIDLLLADGDCTRAGALLIDEGCVFDAATDAIHHDAYRHPAGFEIELHRLFIEPRGIPAIDRRLEEAVREGLCTATTVTLMEDYTFPTLCAEYHALFLLLHMSAHYLTTGFRMRQLYDWVYFWSAPQETETAERLRRLAGEVRLSAFARAITALCVRRLGLPADCAPYADWEDCPETVTEALEAAARMEEGGMLTASDTSLRGLLLILHRETLRQHPQAARHIVTLPLWWVYTGLRFLVNNRRLRRGSALAIVRDARRRGAAAKAMRLFEE